MSEPDAQPEGDLIELEEEVSDVEDTEDGGALIKLDNEKDAEQHLAHFANIVDEVDPGMLNEAVQELLEKIEKISNPYNCNSNRRKSNPQEYLPIS